jgi:membrane protein implicated in regulation of membrane protease activity
MTWQTFCLGAFLLGFLLAAITLVAGFVHFPVGRGLHLPHGGLHGHGHGPVAAGTNGHGHARPTMSPLNFATAMAFLAWFGAAGYLATSRAHAVWLVGLAVATSAGLIGAGVVFGFLTRVLVRHESTLDPADYEMVGTLARVIVRIREGGTGEISFSHGRTRRCSGARSDGAGTAGPVSLPKGAEVVVTRYEKGIAYVRPFEAD